MPFKIRTKLLIAFLAIIFPFTIIAGVLVFYNASAFHKAAHKVETVSEERAAITNIILALERSLMPGNDYIITADRKYIDDFYKASQEVEKRMKEAEGVVSGADDMNMLGDTKAAWRNIKDISQKIFEIQDPHGNKAAANLMEEMDYRWAYPAIERLKKWRGMHLEEYKKAVNISQSVWVRSWTIMGIVVLVLIISGVSFAFFYSNLFVKPIKAIHESADSIARGEFKTRLDINTGDELQQLSGAMNEMAEQLDSFYGTLERQVEDRTKEFKEAEEKYRTMVETSNDWIWTLTPDGRLTFINKQAEDVSGYSYEEWLGKTFEPLILEDDLAMVVDIHNKVIKGEKTHYEVRVKKMDGGVIILSVNASPIFKDGKVTGSISFGRDITERKKAEEALKESETRYKGLIESVTDYIFTVQIENGRPVKTTHGQGCVAITGYASREYETNPNLWLEMVYEGDRDAVVRQGEAVLSGKSEPLEHRIITKGDRIKWVRNVPVPHYDEKGQMVSYDGLISDITERKGAEETLERAKKEWEATFDGITDPLFIHDKELNVVRANRAYQEMAGIKFEEFIGKPYYEVFPKMEKPFRICLKALELQEEEEEEEEEEFSCPLTNRIFKVRFYPIKDVDGGYLYSIHILEDITEVKKAADRIKEEMEVTNHLLMIAEATAHTTDIDKLMQQVVHCSHEIIGCDICLIYAWDEESKVFQPCQEVGLSRDMIPVFRTGLIDEKMEFVRKAVERKEPVVGQVGAGLAPARKGQPQGLPLQWIEGIRTIAVIPLIGKEGCLGLIVGIYTSGPAVPLRQAQGERPFSVHAEPVEARTEQDRLVEGEPIFTERDMKIMRGIMNQVSVALDQARLYKESVDKTLELSHKIETIKVMNQIDRSILSTLKADELLETVTRLLSKVIPCERATVSLVDMERGGFIYKAGFGTAVVPKGAFVPFTDTSARVVFETGRTECVSNLPETPLLPLEKRFLDEGFLSHVRAPITMKGDVIGVLTVGAKRVAAFTKENLSTLEALCSQIGVALSNANLVSDLEELFIGVVKSLSSAIDAKSPWTAGHSERVTKYALDIARQMGLPEKELKDLELAGLLHDVGKIGTYEAILDKPDKLTPEEQGVMRLHPVRGAEILAPIKQLKEIIPGVKYHHEFYDGTGYPEGLKGEAIPLHARILTVADTVDAMGANRPYREGRRMDVIVAELKRCSGTQFDPKVVEAFLKAIEPQRRRDAEETILTSG